MLSLHSTRTGCLLITIFAGSLAFVCQDPLVANLPFCNYKLDIKDRVADLVGRMTLADKVSQLGTGATALSDLAIPAYQWWSEALHGVADSPGVLFGGNVPHATSFPQVIGIAAAFNMSLVRAMGVTISTEARAMYNNGRAGLTYFAPNINLFRDPRWGRGQETPGEDPYLASQYVVQFVKGMQEGDDPRYLKTAVCCKHYAAYDLENWNGTDRHHFNAIVTDQDLVETYLPAFQACVQDGGVASVMCSYNEVNGVPSCANDLLLNQVLRDEWGFNGHVVGDCGAISDILDTHHYTSSLDSTVQVALRGGTDLDCGLFYQLYSMDAYNHGFINDQDLDLAMTRLFTQRMKLGMFDPPDIQPYFNISSSQVNTAASQALALEAAREGIVLLKNDGTLPLTANKIALIGPNSEATVTMQGNYYGSPPFLISPLQGLTTLGVSVVWAQGCDVACTGSTGFAAAIAAAKQGEVVLVVVGLNQTQESEGNDRTEITLPGLQLQLLAAIRNATMSPLVVVLMSGGPVDMSWAKANANALLWVGYPGQSGGQAIAEVLYGKVNPSGRLPYTMYPGDYVTQVSMFNMTMRGPPGRTYKFYTGAPVYPFGYGLSYTTFSYEWTGDQFKSEHRVSHLASEFTVNYRVTVTNTGKISGAVSVLAFVTSDVPGAPLQQLFGFQKVMLDPGASADLLFAVTHTSFMTVDEQGHKTLHRGNYWVHIEDLKHHVMVE